MDTLNQQLKNFRTLKGLSQRAMGKRVGCSHSYICKMENHKTKVLPQILQAYQLLGFKQESQNNDTTFTDNEYQELKALWNNQKFTNQKIQVEMDYFNSKIGYLEGVMQSNIVANDNNKISLRNKLKNFIVNIIATTTALILALVIWSYFN